MAKWVLVFSLGLMSFQGRGQTSGTVPRFDSVLRMLYNTHRFNGTVLYAEKGKVLYRKAFGITDFRTNQPLATSSSFNLASVTKQFVAAGILILRERGSLQLDDDIRKYIPELPYEHISVRNLLTHTSGIPEYFDLFQRYKSLLDTLTNEKMITLFATHRPAADFAAGTKWSYCNTNYVLLVSIIERISKQPIDLFIKNNITVPLGLKNTYVYQILMPSSPNNHVYGFEETGESRKLNDLTPFDGVVGDGNLYSSVEDLYTWAQSLNTEKLLKKESLAEAFQPVKLKDGTTYPYGFGWGIEDEKEQQYAHTGGWAGFRNLIYIDQKNHRTLILLSSGSNVDGIRLGFKFMKGMALNAGKTFVISNVQLIDGTGIPARKASVRVEEKKIIEVGDLHPFEGEEVLDGKGNILAPGFIDSHSHLEGTLATYPEAIAALNQGVTTIVAGQDGESDPVDSIKASLAAIPSAINVASYSGHASLREKIMGRTNLGRPATSDELEKMKELLRADLQKGSMGLSTGLEYEEGFYSDRNEVIELAKVAAAAQARYISHIRSEDINLDDAMEEIIGIGREAKLPVQVSHIKIALKDDWGESTRWLARLESARAEGINITADCYPYDFWNSTLRVLFPKKDFTSLQSAEFATLHLFDPNSSVLVYYKPDSSYAGRTISAIAQLRQESAAKTLIYLIAKAAEYEKMHPDEGTSEAIMGKSMSETDVRNFLSWPETNICSDGGNGGHPRGYGSFTRVLARYVRDMKIMTWEGAIHKMTALSAEHVGISNRGIIAPGYFADLVLIDPANVQDEASIQDSKALSDGILRVWVNGVLVYMDKHSTNKFPGQFVGR